MRASSPVLKVIQQLLRIMSMKNSNDTIGNQPILPPGAPQIKGKVVKFKVQRALMAQRRSNAMPLLFL